MKWLVQQAKIVQGTKLKVHIQENPQDLRGRCCPVVSGA